MKISSVLKADLAFAIKTVAQGAPVVGQVAGYIGQLVKTRVISGHQAEVLRMQVRKNIGLAIAAQYGTRG
jgi:hypothetical protein